MLCSTLDSLYWPDLYVCFARQTDFIFSAFFNVGCSLLTALDWTPSPSASVPWKASRTLKVSQVNYMYCPVFFQRKKKLQEVFLVWIFYAKRSQQLAHCSNWMQNSSKDWLIILLFYFQDLSNEGKVLLYDKRSKTFFSRDLLSLEQCSLSWLKACKCTVFLLSKCY